MPPLRLLIVMPSWLGDCVMATPALRRIRATLPGIFIGGLVRPGMDELLAGTDFFDELHVARASGVLGPKFVAAKVRPRRYDTALLLTNSFSTALITRIAGIPRRIGYERDARGILLTDKLQAPKRPDGSWAPIPAVSSYWHAAKALLGEPTPPFPESALPSPPPTCQMELGTTAAQEAAATELLARAKVGPRAPLAILNPGGNNPAKRWPADRFAGVADVLAGQHGFTVLLNGSPGEAELLAQIAALARRPCVSLASLGVTIGSLKPIVRRSRLMVTNDTGPRHIAAAFGVPLVALFGPTDPRWTTIPIRPGSREIVLKADPTLPASEVADDHPERCRIDRIGLDAVLAAVHAVLPM